ncbi:unnamed protein product [Brassicogethes aeneus]|uniref:Uncharacterized protein n=1 Tax=Brassicogethes aeneus TaxID=1431903 RepID=A0A9P0FBN2_BRAAE|nr:unnamed protein product [Brassicogethes aeneus]
MNIDTNKDQGPETAEASTSQNHTTGTPLKDVPTPFKQCLFWPVKKPTKKLKRTTKEKVPSVASSTQWQEYYKKKQEEKDQKEREKEERKRKREENKENKKLKKKKRPSTGPKRRVLDDTSSSDSSVEVEVQSEEETYFQINELSPKCDSKDLNIGDYVIVIYEGEFFPGLIQKINSTSAFVKVMVKSNINTWKWPVKDDILWYEFKDIKEKIEEPMPTNTRGMFRVAELLKYSVYF